MAQRTLVALMDGGHNVIEIFHLVNPQAHDFHTGKRMTHWQSYRYGAWARGTFQAKDIETLFKLKDAAKCGKCHESLRQRELGVKLKIVNCCMLLGRPANGRLET